RRSRRGPRPRIRRRAAERSGGRGRIVNEIDFVKQLRRYSSLVGDDCAVISPPIGRDLLLTTDFTIEGVHFKRNADAAQVGHQALARSLSDIAAMGGEPLYCLVAIAVAPWTDQHWL